jgi:hypothetical protein
MSPGTEGPVSKRADFQRLERDACETPASAVTPCVSGLVEAVLDYMHVGNQELEVVELSGTPERLLAVLGQPPAADEAEAIARFMEIDDAFFAGGLEMWFDASHIVFGLHWTGCPRRFWRGRKPDGIRRTAESA